MNLSDIRSILPTIVQEVTDINYAQVIVDQSQLTEFLQKRNKDDNNMLFFVIPEYSRRGNEDSTIRVGNYQALIFRKYAERDSHEDFLNLMQSTEDTIKALEEWMLLHKAQNPCGIFAKYIDSSSLITPVWDFVSCHGHSLNFEVEKA